MRNRAHLLLTISLVVCGGGLTPLASSHQDNSEKEIRDWEMRRDALNRVSEARSRPMPHRRGVPLPEHSQDFKRIRSLNFELKQAAARGGTLDLKFVAKSASEIKKSAKRLKDGLALPKSEEGPEGRKTEVEAGPEQLRVSLNELGELITEFVSNPVFKETRVVNAKLLVKAGRDLEEIIELSSRVKKSSEKLAARGKAEKTTTVDRRGPGPSRD